jgi:hypothetical protein
MSTLIESYAKRPYRYANIDGLNEMGGGIFFLLWALLWHLESTTSAGSIWKWKSTHLTLPILIILVVFYWCIPALKRRITFPRTGYVRYPGIGSKRWASSLLFGIVGIAVAIPIFFLLRHRPHFMVFIGGIAFAFLYLMHCYFSGGLGPMWRMAAFLVLILSSLLISSLPIDSEDATVILTGLFGCTVLISGILTLVSYLRCTSPPQEEAE